MINSDPLTIRFVCMYEDGNEELECPCGRIVEELGLECWEDKCEYLWIEEWNEG